MNARQLREKNRLRSAVDLHKNVPADWYFASMKRNLLQRWWHTSRFNEVQKVSDPVKGKILDIGSADGVFTDVIARKTQAKEVIGIDVLEKSVKWANKHWNPTSPKASKGRGVSRMRFQVGDAHDLDFRTGSFDAVFALEVLEHVHRPDVVLGEIKRILKKRGYAVFLVPSDNTLFNIIWFLVRKFWWAKIWDDAHIQTYRNNTLPKLCKKVGFKVEVDKKFWLGMLHLVKVRKK
jgi:2-polyprenyl-3-methyl-5-hydroxy-6-metoxy-1,4-benzoquinol methylase